MGYSPNSNNISAHMAMPAVSVRKMRGPRETTFAPFATRLSTSST